MSQLDLPYDRVATAPSHAGDAYNFTVPLELVRELEALAHEEKCTLYETLLAGWVTLMHRYTGQTDFPVGTLAAGRELAEERAITGLFANTLVLRCDVSESPSFVALMHRLQGVVVHSLAHQHVPFDQVVRALGVARTGDLNPLIQSMFVQVPPPGIAPVAPGMSSTTETAKIDGGSSTIAKYNLCLAMAETAGGLRATLEYATDLFDRSSVERMATHFEMILRAAVERPSTPIGELSLLTVEERHRLMVAWNSTAAPRPDHRCVPELFTERARLHPDRVALECRGERVTYGELDRRSNRLARHLVAVAVGPGSLVGICVERSTDMIVGLLAIAKAGGAYIPLDPGYPSERIAYVLEDSKADVLLTTEELLALFPRAACRVVRFRDAGTESEEGLAPRATENDLAYAIYTSGSTGKPKGVAVHHAALVNTLLHFAEELEFTEADTVLGLTSLSFDIAGLEIWLPLITGGTIDLLTREEAVDGRVLMRELDRATVMQATPATWQILLDAGWQGGRPLRALCGGEAMPWSLATALAQRATRVWNVYGPTETTIWSTTWEVDVGRKRVAVGRGIANTQIYVLDKLLQPVPVGIPGEVYIAGVGVGRGYLHRPSLTDEKFVPNPFADAPGARMYSTGDTGRWASDGSLEHIGRTDDQVKIRGFRVELGEIETVLSAHASVRACAVVVRHEAREAGGSRLVAFVVGDVSPTERDEVREYLARVLPPYMVPSAIVVEAELPLLPNGKVDRRTLTVKAKSVNTTIEAEVKPQTATEASLAGIWKRVLDREEIDVRRTFFEQGGTSLQLVRVQRMIGEELGADLTVADFFRFPTVEELAKHLEHANAPGEKLAVKDDVAVVAPARSTIADETDQLTAEQVREQLRRTLETLSES
jgi:amino acid adenylation domain-containing protein